MGDTSIAANRSALKDFLASIATISGDLSNITAPPFLLAENSTVEIPQYWCDHAHLFVRQAWGETEEQRALNVLESFMGALRNQQYAGRDEGEGVKKPLNAFLGELFLGKWEDEELGETKLVSEQVSHHPPITACYIWNDKHGVRAEGFTEQEITFSGSVSIKQKGYAILHIDEYDEDYLMPVPNVKVKGILGGRPYPELQGSYSLISSTGYVSEIKFEGKSFFGGGQKNGFEAKMFHVSRPDEILYEAKGTWNGESTFEDARTGKAVQKLDFATLKSLPLQIEDTAEQDPWESRRAWGDVIAALKRGDMKAAADAKSIVEQGQRQMRKDEIANGTSWKNRFFKSVGRDEVFDTLSKHDTSSFTVDRKGGIWKVDKEAIHTAQKPYHGDLLPTNERTGASGGQRDAASGGQTRSQSEATAAVPTNGVSQQQKFQASGEEAPTQHSIDPLAQADLPVRPRTELPDTRVTETPKGPTDAQVEEFLRNKYSASPR
ncbi:Oxysterol-binding protein [Macroventuria anomochaeta]|uniref:Oxysterol-binding protein n=1 Tax=Macroventuria anomochaeta TaxID=301207 RepID=A0ACB6SCJ2_9PLEO|nr:Oxysterol-binding protein [Macroventuria anomochaeta]KAF2631058.1 Oxysterol-binding protein [Macroventuria anomochaeta]